MLGDLAAQVQERWSGDLRKMRTSSGGDVRQIQEHLTDLKGLGPVGADIFLREVQRCWPEVAPYVDKRAKDAAKALGLPTRADALGTLVDDVARLVAALVRTSLEKDADDVKQAAS